MSRNTYSDIIRIQTAQAKSGEFKLWDKVDKFFLSKPWTDTTIGESEAELMKTSENHVFPIVETAAAMLSPANPQVTFTPRARTAVEKLPILEAYANACFDEGKLRKHLALAIQSVVKYGRCPMKSAWDKAARRSKHVFVNPRSHFFDRTAMMYEDISYEFETTVLSTHQLKKRVEQGLYDRRILEHRKTGQQMPTYLRPLENQKEPLLNYRPWTVVHEFYDYDAGRVAHLLEDDPQPILVEDITRRPFRLLTFNHNGSDAGGVSEIGLILPNAEQINWTATFLLNILRFGIPREFYDARLMSEEETGKVLSAPLGAWKGVKVPAGTAVRDGFHQSQLPQHPPLARELMEDERQEIARTSALSDAMRAQTIGARTATEVAFLDGHTKNRLRPRSSCVDELIEDLASDGIALAQNYLDEEVEVMVEAKVEPGKPPVARFVAVNPHEIQGVLAKPKIVAYSPMESNAAVRMEMFRNLQPLFLNNPLVNQKRFLEKILDDAELGSDVLNTEEEMQMAAKAMAPAPAAGAPPPAEEPPPEPGGTTLPPRAAGLSDVVANPTEP